MQADDALANWQQWGLSLQDKPTVLRPLTGGRSNRSFLLDSSIGQLVLRLNGVDSYLPGSTRNHESQIWQAASSQGIAPPLLYMNTQNSVAVSVYVDNSLPAQAPVEMGYINQVFDLLKRCHQLEVNAPAIDYSEHIESYWNGLKINPTSDSPLARQHEAMQSLLKELLHSGSKTGLCHHDPVVANFVGDVNQLYLIDWEYAARGLLVMDYAALGFEWRIDDAVIIERTGIERDLLKMARTLYEYICDLWNKQMDPGFAAGKHLMS